MNPVILLDNRNRTAHSLLGYFLSSNVLLDGFVGLRDRFDGCLLGDLPGLGILDSFSSFLDSLSSLGDLGL